jgi:hypothetical protein
MIPLVYTKDPGKFWGFAIPPLAMGGGVAGPIPARPAALTAGGEGWGEEKLT